MNIDTICGLVSASFSTSSIRARRSPGNFLGSVVLDGLDAPPIPPIRESAVVFAARGTDALPGGDEDMFVVNWSSLQQNYTTYFCLTSFGSESEMAASDARP
jgi:hypothetical protein